MGNDGGSIQRRCEVVKLKKKKQKPEREEQNRSKWTLCALSKQKLAPPIVACKLGYLYNKMALLEALLDGTLPPEFSHIKKAKRDVIDLSLQSLNDDAEDAKFVCPVTGLALGGNYRFVAVKKCGCVIAERAWKEIPDQNVCLNCSTPFDPESDILILNGTEEEVNQLKEKLKKKQSSRKRKSSSKKKPAKKIQKTGVSSSANTLGPLIASAEVSKNMPKSADPSIYKSLFTSSVADATEGETFCCRHVGHRLG
eukprot:CAMPEP_0206199076 /NCGR_PEP_ID=MMETSP0166-20121206/10036_1 /ASSEMBLY_ACC=CAM_ASM_000260 /TAXON_ID=95228 /ORGANISM="Vannella robusta, Strain DIVA3 518/3/11/1/6" /LENGTH=253 /DNA_ID=CAMNT_0053617089 /DNA_START=536 /DNA_END=1297 /DNA_ORIENTATION=+